MCSRAASDEISSGVTLNLRGWQNPVTRSELAWERCRRFSRHENSVSPLFFQWTSKTFVTPWDLLHKEGYQTWNNGEANKTKAYFLRTGEKKKRIKNTKKGSRIFIPFSFLPHVLSLSKWIENCLFKHVPPLSVFSFMWPHTQTPSVSSDSLPKQSRFLASVQIIYHAGGNLWF